MASISSRDIRETIAHKVQNTPLIDTHEHLMEESTRLAGVGAKHGGAGASGAGASGTAGPGVGQAALELTNPMPCDDWSYLFSHYLDSDLISAGMSQADYDALFSPHRDPLDKWPLLEPLWPAVRNTGYGQAVAIALRELYGIDTLSAATIGDLQKRYEAFKKPGFYREILRGRANIQSCQVNSLEGTPFRESEDPLLLMQDFCINERNFVGPNYREYAIPAGITIRALADWYAVMDWWYARYGTYAVAVKSQNAYERDIDYVRVARETAEPLFAKRLSGDPMTAAEKKALEDHLFWYAADGATRAGLPVKLHTGYYAGANRMPLDRLVRNPGSATQLCMAAPDTRFVFMHICYPYYEELISIAKHYTNAYVDMCWAWIVNPVAAKDFLKKYLVSAPSNKILTFGGDYMPVEPVLGHAAIARRGIAAALAELVDEGYYTLDEALETSDSIMHGNARRIFKLDQKEKALADPPWLARRG
jgi:predicted TIM-barrel fold metal-dependent hydrolase